jgi:hypothetical protein
MGIDGDAEHAVRHLREAAMLWNVGLETCERIVACAVDALIADVEAPSLALLAGLTRREAATDGPDLARDVLSELGSPLAPYGSDDAKVGAARALAEMVLHGEGQPCTISFKLEKLLFPDVLDLALPFMHLNNDYDLAEDHPTAGVFDLLDDGVLREAQRLLDRT